MTVRAARAKKPEMVDEVVRTLQAYDLLASGVTQRLDNKRGTLNMPDFIALLGVAERIAARTAEEK